MFYFVPMFIEKLSSPMRSISGSTVQKTTKGHSFDRSSKYVCNFKFCLEFELKVLFAK